jgi:uncharacterized protein (TIGR02246 family)
MTKSILIAAMVAFAAAGAVESFAAAQANEEIKQGFAQLDRCLADNDAKCVGELFVEDATFSAPTIGNKIIKGKAQIVKTLDDMFAGAPGMKGAKRTHTVENVRMIGQDHAVVDASVAVTGMKAAEGADAAGPGHSYHAVAVMILKGDKWLFEDMRSYAVEVAKKPAEATAPTAGK